jgi:ABC-2 type transport system ATP-binding protein
MKILTGYHYPSRGEAYVQGLSVEAEPLELKRRIGYLPESVPLYGDLTVDEYLRFVADARCIPAAAATAAIDKAVEACGLGGYRRRKIETLSKGYKQRTGLAQAILHDPPILILDEPTSGLDPNQIIEIRSLIRRLGATKTVILSTHIMQEVEAVCSNVLILNEGRIAAQGTPAEISATLRGGNRWELLLKAPEADLADTAPGSLVTLTNAEEAAAGLTRLELALPGTESLAEEAAQGESLSDWVSRQGGKIIGMTRKTLSLEDIFVKLTHDDGAENATEVSHNG